MAKISLNERTRISREARSWVDRELELRWKECDEEGHYAPNNPNADTCGHCFRFLEYTPEVIAEAMKFGSYFTEENVAELPRKAETGSNMNREYGEFILSMRKNPRAFAEFVDKGKGIGELTVSRIEFLIATS